MRKRTGRSVAEIVSEAVQLTAGSMAELVDELGGVTRQTVHAWTTGARNPSPTNRARIIEVMRRRGGELAELADQLETIDREA